MNHPGRGKIAVEDMRARIQAGWTISMLWARMEVAEKQGKGYVYDYAVDPVRPVEVSVED